LIPKTSFALINKLSIIVPRELGELRKRESELSSQIDNLISLIPNGGPK